MTKRLLAIMAPFALVALPLAAQGHQHTPGMTHPAAVDPPKEPGQAAFGAIAEIVARLEADPATDWTKVNLEGLRRHLVDMDNVTMRSRIATQAVDGGFVADVTGDGEVASSIGRMLTAHVAQMASETGLKGTAVPIEGGIRLTVVAADPTDPATVARIRGLGAIGILASGGHHGVHHEAMARGSAVHAH
jgi:hypothetical protein